jgi:thiamine-phosphate pyrophosphorylase
MFEIPCVVLAGTSFASVTEAAETRAEFVGVRDGVWMASGDPASAVAEINRRLDAVAAAFAEAETA